MCCHLVFGVCQGKEHSNLFETKSPLSSWPMTPRTGTFAWVPTNRVIPRGCHFGLPYCPAIGTITLSSQQTHVSSSELYCLRALRNETLLQSPNHTVLAFWLKVKFNASFFFGGGGGYFRFLCPEFRKLLKPNERFTLQKGFWCSWQFYRPPVNSRTSKLYCMWQLASRLRLLLIVLSARWLLEGSRTWKSLDSHCQKDCWEVTALRLGGHERHSLQSQSRTQRFRLLWTP